MTKDELLAIAKKVLAKYRAMPYSDLAKKVGALQPETDAHGDPKNQDFYQTEVEVVYDDRESGNLRVIGMIDDGKGLSGIYNLIFSPDGSLLSEGGNVSSRRTDFFFKPALSLFLLRELPFARFDFPRWQSVLAISLIGVLVGLDPGLRAGTPQMPGLPLVAAIPFMVLSVWAAFLIILGVLRWWMQRGGRWDGQGDLFNLVAASWLLASILGAGLTALGVPYLLTLPLWLYSVWVGAHALSGAIPKASLGYGIAGIVIGLIPAMLVTGVLFAVLGVVMTMLGLVPPPPGAGPEGMG